MKKLIATALVSTIALTGCLNQQETQSSKVQPKIEEPKVSFGAWTDQMTGKRTHFVELKSINSHNFAWPYDKNTKAYLIIAEDNTVQVRLSSGQVMCRSYTRCYVPVKFDDNNIQTELGLGFANGRSDGLFFCNNVHTNCKSKKFINKIKSSKTMKVQVEVYQQGNPVFEFDTSEYMDHPALIKVKS